MRGSSGSRRRNHKTGSRGKPTDPFDMAPTPKRDTVLRQVRQLTESLEGAIDEGTGAALDRLIESWAGSWIAVVESEYVDHCAVISVHRGQAQQGLTEASAIAQHEREELDRIRSDYLTCRQRLTGERPDQASSGDSLAPAGVQDPEHVAGPVAPAAEAAAPSTRPAPQPDWSAPHLVAGRGLVGIILGAILILIGALADTIAFKNILELILRTESETVSWVMASGATSMALVSAALLGVARTIRRRGRHWAPRHRPTRLPLILSGVVWLALGLTMFLVRWLDHAATGVQSFGSFSVPAQSTIWVALFFGAIYLISGTCTMFEAERLYNPDYFAFRRLGKKYRKQAKRVAKADARADRAHAALDLHSGELDREDQLRIAAITSRKTLAAEAANYSRVIMASMMRDPAKTNVTQTGPVPEMPSPLGAEPSPNGDSSQATAGVAGTV
jgi:hypothetical protein